MRRRGPGRAPRIVMFTPGVSEIGGAANRSRLLAEGLAERGFDVRVLARSGAGRWFTSSEEPGVRTLEVPGFGIRGLGALTYLAVAVPLGLAWGRSAKGFVAIQLTAPALVAGIVGLVLRKPYVACTSTTGDLSEVGAVVGSAGAGVRKRLLARARYLIAQSEAGVAELLELVPKAQTAVIPSPIRLGRGSFSLDNAPRVAYVGRLSSEKDLLRLLVAWREVLGLVPGGRLTLVGEGGVHRSVEAEIREMVAVDPALRESVTLTGWVADVSPYLARSDVFVLPSLTEGMSNALLEACAHDRVVVASDIPSNRAVLGDTYPLLFTPGDTSEMTAALHRALSDEATRAAALDTIRCRIPAFDLRIVTEALLDLVVPGLAREGGRR
jgi:glycosyltransferase involved in cell wall biosynthesis